MTTTLRAGEADAICGLLNRELGADLYSPLGIGTDAISTRAHVRRIDDGGRVIAAAVSRLMERGDADYYMAFGSEVRGLFRREPIGSFEAVAVDPGARRRGLATGLLEDALSWFRSEGCAVGVAVSWLSGREESSAGMFRRAGMVAGRVVADFYLNDSIRDAWTCPVCAGPCHCAAQLFHRRF